jgi:hypothetical protein
MGNIICANFTPHFRSGSNFYSDYVTHIKISNKLTPSINYFLILFGKRGPNSGQKFTYLEGIQNLYSAFIFYVVFSLNWLCWDIVILCQQISFAFHGFWDKLNWMWPKRAKFCFSSNFKAFFFCNELFIKTLLFFFKDFHNLYFSSKFWSLN